MKTSTSSRYLPVNLTSSESTCHMQVISWARLTTVYHDFVPATTDCFSHERCGMPGHCSRYQRTLAGLCNGKDGESLLQPQRSISQDPQQQLQGQQHSSREVASSLHPRQLLTLLCNLDAIWGYTQGTLNDLPPGHTRLYLVSKAQPANAHGPHYLAAMPQWPRRSTSTPAGNSRY